MQLAIQHPAFKEQRLVVETAHWFRGPRLLLNGTVVPKKNGRYTAAVVKLVVAFVLIIQAAFCVLFDSIFGAVVGFRCTSTMRFQLRVEPDQRFGLA